MANFSLKTDSQLEDLWSRLLVRLDSSNERLIADLESCWRDLQGILESQIKQLNATAPAALEAAGLDAFRKAREEAGRALLDEPYTQWERRRPYRRAMIALESYDRGLEELIRALPESIGASGTQAFGLLGHLVAGGSARRFARLRRKERPLSIRAIVVDEAGRLANRRAKAEGEYLLVLARAIQQLRRDWEVRREALDAAARGEPPQKREAEALKQEAESYAVLVKQAESSLSAWRKWPEITKRRLAERILDGVVWRRKVRPSGFGDERTANLTHWGEQSRSLEAEIGLERALERNEDAILNMGRRSLESLAQERANLLAEMDGFTGWLRQRQAGEGQTEVPPPRTDIVPAASRVAELDGSLRSALQTLPPTVRILTKFHALPPRRMKARELHPAETAYEAFERSGRGEVRDILQAVETEHYRIVREVEQAREVVAFGLSADKEEQKRDPRIEQEALQNALSLLEFHRGEAAADLKEADALLARTMAAVFDENRLILSRNRLGALAYLGQQSTRQAAATVSRNAVAAAKRGIGLAWSTLQDLGHRFLVSIGWVPEGTAGISEIVKRPFLPQEFTVDLGEKELPAIYRRLFRFEAVQDPRFLVGREREMEAIAEARGMWEAGRPVAVLIIGERGSGKSSLINCAMKRPLEGLEVVRGEFSERLSNAARLREFLAALLGLDDPADLERSLNQQRRVLILEEMERSFLRQIGHYAAMRELQKLIAATCRNTLWIVVTNQIAFRFLDAAVSLGQSFSHRINAASATRDALRDAILLRHNLSGLRLQFSLPPEERTLASRVRNRLRGQADPERIVFDELAKESAGVFRTAFEIWLGQIDAAQAGGLSMKPLAAPDLTPIIDALDTDDLFTLVAVLQHGSLTPEECATIFQKSLAASQAQIDELRAREIIEEDPHRIGFRVRPEALRVVKEALYRRNLL
ncbi:MAG: AAA family ATPase [Blastocatellia bacterium]